jgi:UDPglucose 6-dehydrogenase
MSATTEKNLTIIGPGRLGLAVALLFEKAGYKVLAMDKNEDYISALKNGTFNSPESGINELLNAANNISFSSDFDDLIAFNSRNILVYVPTPENDHGYDHTILDTVFDQLVSFGNRNVDVNLILGSTTLPSYCNTVKSNLLDFGYKLVYSPEFIAQGTIIKNLQYPDILLLGSSHIDSMHEVEDLYDDIYQQKPLVHTMDCLSAEITKLATNCFLTAKIAFANAIGDLAIKTGANHESILNAVGSDSRIGNKYLGYGFGFGGPCFPRDNRALNYFANNRGYPLKISDATVIANNQHTEFQIQHYLEKYLADSTIEFEHITYKPDSDILEESQQLRIAVALAEKGRKVKINGNSEVLSKVRKLYGEMFIYP